MKYPCICVQKFVPSSLLYGRFSVKSLMMRFLRCLRSLKNISVAPVLQSSNFRFKKSQSKRRKHKIHQNQQNFVDCCQLTSSNSSHHYLNHFHNLLIIHRAVFSSSMSPFHHWLRLSLSPILTVELSLLSASVCEEIDFSSSSFE